MPIIRRRGRKLLYAGLAGAGVMGVLLAGGFYFVQSGSVKQFAQEKQQYRQRIQDLEAAQLDRLRSMKTAWIPLKDLPAGHFLDRKDLQEVRLPADLSPDNMPLKLEQLTGKGTKIELRKGTPITLAMLYDEEVTPPDLRNKEMKSVWLPSNLKVRDTVDIRIQFPTGQDYIVLSKKVIDKLSAPAFWTTLSEQEILLLSSAMVDAYLHKASLYALTYVEPEMQQKAVPNYPPNQEVIALIKRDPNVVNKAERQLESSIRTALDRDLEKMDPGRSIQSSGSGDMIYQQSRQESYTWPVRENESRETASEPETERTGDGIRNDRIAESEEIFGGHPVSDSVSAGDSDQQDSKTEAIFTSP